MAKYLKILLLFVFVTAPALDIAFLDNQETTDHFSEAQHDTVKHEEGSSVDLHCICHVLHHGASIGKNNTQNMVGIHIKTRRITTLAVIGQHPKPGLHPPSTTLS